MNRLPFDLIDLMGLLGLVLLGYGLWWIYWPLVFVASGVLLLGLAMVGAWGRGRRD